MWREHCLRSQSDALIAGLLMAGALLAGCAGLEPGGVTADTGPNPGVYPPSAIPFGKTYGEWSVVWVRWLLSMPGYRNPVRDPDGRYAGEGQSGPVWFLAGTLGTEAERWCTVPGEKAILFPLVNGYFWVPTDASTCDLLPGVAEECLDQVTEVEAIVDGVPLRGLRNYRFRSPGIFQFTGDCEDPIYPGQCGFHECALADGYYVMLEPLSPGEHEIHFGGKIVWPVKYPDTHVFEVRVTYHLTIE